VNKKNPKKNIEGCAHLDNSEKIGCVVAELESHITYYSQVHPRTFSVSGRVIRLGFCACVRPTRVGPARSDVPCAVAPLLARVGDKEFILPAGVISLRLRYPTGKRFRDHFGLGGPMAVWDVRARNILFYGRTLCASSTTLYSYMSY
jgi:acyl-coenzyme A thioesterase PaaI-like protein